MLHSTFLLSLLLGLLLFPFEKKILVMVVKVSKAKFQQILFFVIGKMKMFCSFHIVVFISYLTVQFKWQNVIIR